LKQIKANLNQLAKNLRINQTDAEKILWKLLKSKQLDNTKFRRQQPIGNYIVDFVSLDKKLVIELDGGQHAEDENKDQKRDRWLISQGFKVLRFWNNDVLQNIEGVLESIMEKISPSPSPSPQGRGEEKLSSSTLTDTSGPQERGNVVRMIAWEVTRSCNLNCAHLPGCGQLRTLSW